MLSDYGVYKRELVARWSGDDEEMFFLRRAVTLLSVPHVTLEAMAHLFLVALVGDGQRLAADSIHGIVVRVGSGPGQLASSAWS